MDYCACDEVPIRVRGEDADIEPADSSRIQHKELKQTSRIDDVNMLHRSTPHNSRSRPETTRREQERCMVASDSLDVIDDLRQFEFETFALANLHNDVALEARRHNTEASVFCIP